MRMMVQMTIPAEAGNAAIKDGSLMTTIQSALADLKAEAAYFCAFGGERNGFIVFDMKDTSEIPGIAERFFLAFNAKVNFYPVMNAADLAASGPGIAKAVAAHGG
ncbi:MAG TPA: hypothetical protein VN841_06460 [Bryobacteraceae bacterium]|nr:hypothetical protein [Bryobacteraceae bacterium]